MADGSDDDRIRDLLPVPLGEGLDSLLLGASAMGTSSSQRRRARRRRGQEDWLRDGLASLNALGGGGREVPQHAPLTEGQRTAVRGLAGFYGNVGAPPEDLDPLGAWQTLQGDGAGYRDDSSVAGVARAVFRRGAVSLPRPKAGLVNIATLLVACSSC